MKSFFIISFCLVFFIPISVFPQIPVNNLQITNIASEGFLLASSNKKVLIDALYSDGYGFFSVPPKEVINNIMAAKAPFENLNLMMLTHYHKDHCDPLLINEFLSKHKDIPFVTSKPSIVFIDGSCFGFVKLKKQFAELTPETNTSISKTINGIPVKAFALKHLSFYVDSIDVEENMYDISFLFDMDGIKVFHSGDIKKNALQDYLGKYGKWTDPIDIAFLYYELFENGLPDLEFIVNTMHPKYIVVMHTPPNMFAEWTAKVEKFKSVFPNIILFKNPMESQTISIAEINLQN